MSTSLSSPPGRLAANKIADNFPHASLTLGSSQPSRVTDGSHSGRPHLRLCQNLADSTFNCLIRHPVQETDSHSTSEYKFAWFAVATCRGCGCGQALQSVNARIFFKQFHQFHKPQTSSFHLRRNSRMSNVISVTLRVLWRLNYPVTAQSSSLGFRFSDRMLVCMSFHQREAITTAKSLLQFEGGHEHTTSCNPVYDFEREYIQSPPPLLSVNTPVGGNLCSAGIDCLYLCPWRQQRQSFGSATRSLQIRFVNPVLNTTHMFCVFTVSFLFVFQ